jgi:hypothetical protein
VWLYLNELDSATSVRKLVGFYVEQHNTVVPHFAFEGQTPDEMYFGTGASVPATLKQKRDQARAARLAHNRGDLCEMQSRGCQASDGDDGKQHQLTQQRRCSESKKSDDRAIHLFDGCLNVWSKA